MHVATNVNHSREVVLVLYTLQTEISSFLIKCMCFTRKNCVVTRNWQCLMMHTEQYKHFPSKDFNFMHHRATNKYFRDSNALNNSCRSIFAWLSGRKLIEDSWYGIDHWQLYEQQGVLLITRWRNLESEIHLVHCAKVHFPRLKPT